MPLETASFINGLDATNPAAGDTVGQADDHLRLIKATLKATFPNVTGAITPTHTEINGILARLAALETSPGTPIGTIRPFAGASVPALHVLCDGRAVSRTTYAALFSALGTAWGSGDGSTTFNVPDLRGRVLVGKDDMGGTAANRVTSAGSGINAAVLGASGGSQFLQAHTHTASSGSSGSHTHTASTGSAGDHNHTGTTSANGDHAHTTTISLVSGTEGNAALSGLTGGDNAISSHSFTSSTAGAHSHTFTTSTAGAHTHSVSVSTEGAHTHSVTVDSAGAGSSGNMPPSAVVNFVIYTGV
jgi:microcystin-dependent protein